MRRESDWLTKRASLTPNKTAVVEISSGIRLTYQELHMRASRLAHYLAGSGVKKGDRVALVAPNSIAYLDLLFAADKLGCIFVPLNYRFSIPEMEYVLKDCQPKYLIYYPTFMSHVEKLQENVQGIALMDFTTYHSVVTNNEEVSFSKIDLDMEDPWAIIYTGGTTGRPKGAILSHRAITWNSINTIISWGLQSDDITPVYIPMFHTGGLNSLTTPVLHVGGTVIIGSEFDPPNVLKTLEQERCTIVLFVPTMYQMLIQLPEFRQATFPDMRVFLSGGAPCPHSVYQAFMEKDILFKEGYGMTESGPNNFYIDPEDAKRKLGSVGVPMFHNTIRIVDENGLEVESGEMGEIWISGPHLFSAYWNLPEVTSETLVDGWLKTGDYGKRDQDGYHYIVGRKKDMILSGGENIYPLEVEHVLRAHPAVEDVVVVGIPDPKWGEIVTAVIVTRPGAKLDLDTVKQFCKEQIAAYKAPKQIYFASKLPQTSVGKIDKKLLVQMYSKAGA